MGLLRLPDERLWPSAAQRRWEGLMRVAVMIIAVLLAATTGSMSPEPSAVASPAPSAAAEVPCAAPRVMAESQAWWQPAPGAPAGAKDFGHVHLGACIPERDVLASPTSVRLRLIMHENPGRLADISVVLKGTDYEITTAEVAPLKRRCASTCEQWITVRLDPAKFREGGLQEVRFRVFVDEPDGNQMHTSINWQLYVDNGKSRNDVTRHPHLRGKGWYTDFGYCEADLLTRPLPDGPVRGNLRLRMRQVDHGPDDVNPSSHLVALDADSHAGIPGTVLSQGRGPLRATSFTIDTTTLSDGPHRLVQRVSCESGDQINSGVLVLVFTTDNHPD